ncbi:chitinase [Yersinia entomophaga]|uniref:chitinase n=1 Tax=Yersinia entomophaga TaxID=935293 RepID=A0ABM6BLT9_YERET|nr:MULTISPECIES: glycosyl hydrolase family 18 protein [Yersinia]ANI30527.1 chitinase [Yersinia entomophaga]OWF86849.1 chitinase [Yersinia entomophaga]
MKPINCKNSLITILTLCTLFGFSHSSAFAASVNDDASVMPSLVNKKIMAGFWHNWDSQESRGYQGGYPKNLKINETPAAFNVVIASFMKGSGIPTFKPYNATDAEFRAQIGELNKQGRAVLISLGGADAHVALNNGQEQAFADEIIRLVETYGFDGLDIDLEQTAINAANNTTVIPAALKIVRAHYEQQGKHFIISMAPEFPYLTTGRPYTTYINALDGVYDFIAPQLYNQGGDGVWVEEVNLWLAQNNDAKKYEFLYYMADSIVNGKRGFIKIPANKLVLGLPSNVDAAASGTVKNPQDVYRAFADLEKAGTPIKGLMTWSVNWDQGKDKAGNAYNQAFAKAYTDLIHGK